MRKQWVLLSSLCIWLVSCQPTDTESSQPVLLLSGSAQFSRYVAVGDGLSVGYQNNVLSQEGQNGSFPNLLAQVLGQAGGGKFLQPPLVLRYAGPPLSNLGVPGLRLGDVQVPGLAQTNPFFERLLPTSQPTLTYLEWVKSQTPPTFFSLWLGYNDAFDFVTTGGTRPTTDLGLFTKNLNALLDVLLTSGTKGVLGNLPDPATLPLLTTRTFANLPGPRNVPIYIRTGNGTVRPATGDDLLLTTADSIGISNRVGFPKGFVSAYPLNNEDVLDVDEVAQAQATVSAYNKAITDIATARQLPVMNANSLYRHVQATAKEATDGSTTTLYQLFFSTDSAYPTRQGYLLIANECIRVINTYYGSKLPGVTGFP